MDLNFIRDYINERKVWSLPIGVEKNSLNVHCYPFDASYITTVMSDGDSCLSFIGSMTELLGTVMRRSGTVLDAANRLENETGTLKRCASKAECAAEIAELFKLVKDRNNSYKDAIAEGAVPPTFEPYVIVINGISDLIGLLEATEKEMLSLILLKGQSLYNLAVIIGDTAKNYTAFTYEKWYKTNCSQSDGIWVGSGIDEQYQIKINRITSEMHEELTPKFGYSILKGKAVKIKLLNTDEEEELNDAF